MKWTGYNGGLDGRAPKGRKFFKKVIEIGHVKLKNLNHFPKIT